MDFLELMRTLFGFLIAVILVPGILALILLLATRAAWRVEDEDHNRGRRIAAWLFGLALVALIVTFHVFGRFFAPPKGADTFEDLIIFAVLGVIVGPVLLALFSIYAKNEVLEAMFIALLTGASLTALYFYAFIEAFRGAILAITLGMIVGGLGYAILDERLAQRLAAIFRHSSPPRRRY